MKNIELIHGDCLIEMQKLESGSIDAIVTDPPYKYLKHKLDRDWDENVFFNEAKRVLKQDGFIVLFGRGTSFYRWNTMLADLGFKFKEEVVWDKQYGTSPVGKLFRVHETTTISGLGNSKLNDVRIDYVMARKYELDNLIKDINRIKSALNSVEVFNEIKKYLKDKFVDKKQLNNGRGVTIDSDFCGLPRHITLCNTFINGLKPKSIIAMKREHYGRIHPTQKPVGLMQILIKLVSNEGDKILDPFAGSASTAVACANTNRGFIGYEIDNEYYELASKRLKKELHRLF